MTRKRMAVLLSASMLLAAGASPAAAGSDGWKGGLRGYGHFHVARSGSAIGYTTPVLRVRGVGTFSRSVWTIGHWEASELPRLAPKAKVILVDDKYLARSGGCSYEAGVCVVRAGY